jgi:hypothetical protein
MRTLSQRYKKFAANSPIEYQQPLGLKPRKSGK